MTWVVELNGVDNTDGVAKTVLFAMGAGFSPTDAPHIEGGALSWRSPTQKIDISREGMVTLSGDNGQFVVSNLPPDTSSPGPNDYLVRWAWHTRRANLYWVEALWADRTLVAFGSLQQPVGTMSTADSPASTLAFALRDPRSALTGQLQAAKFAGTNTAGEGVEGEADIKGRPKPIVYGLVSNIPGVKVNAQKQVWQLADKAATVLCVRDGAGAIAVDTVRGSLASLLSNEPDPGKYDVYSGSEGTFVRLATAPKRVMTFDVAEGGVSDAARTHAQVWSRIRTERCGTVAGDINSDSIDAVDASAPDPVGFYWADQITQLDALNEVLGSLSGYEVLGFDDEWRIGRLSGSSGAAVLNLVPVSETAEVGALDRPYRTMARARTNFAPDGVPPCRVNVKWGRNYQVMSTADFIGYVTMEAPRLVDKFTQEWRTETAANADIWDPDALTGLYPNAPELTVRTGYQPGADDLTCPHAEEEAERLLALFSRLPAQYQASFIPEKTDRLLPGDVITAKHPQFKLEAGPKFRVMQVGWMVDENGVMADLVFGLQSGEPQLDFSKAENSQYLIFLTL